MNHFEAWARYYDNFHLLLPEYRAVIHLEDEEDKLFWDGELQKTRPGRYWYLFHSKSKRGKETSGCDQCLKYRGYLTPHFFVCIDSDLRQLLQETGIDASHYVLQTYTYSWENHFCEKNALQHQFSKAAVLDFNFASFLTALSKAVYDPLLLLLFCERTGNRCMTHKDFRHVLRTQCSAAEVMNDGAGYVESVHQGFLPFLCLGNSQGFDIASERQRYEKLGLIEDNAYLHIRGHNLYDLVLYIGNMKVSHLRLNFEKDVLQKVQVGGEYWEYQRVVSDIKSL